MKTKDEIIKILSKEFAFHRFCGEISLEKTENKSNESLQQEDIDRAVKLSNDNWAWFVDDAKIIYEEIMDKHINIEENLNELNNAILNEKWTNSISELEL